MKWLVIAISIVVLSSIVGAAEIDPAIYTELQHKSSVGVIVELKEMQPIDQLKTASVQQRQNQLELRKTRIGNGRQRLLRKIGLHPDKEYSNINAFTGNITSDVLARLENASEIQSIHLKEELQIQLADTRLIVGADRTEVLSLNSTYITGRGQTICIVDTGIDYNHVNLGAGWGKVVIDGYDYINNDPDPMDDHGHGTHVAGIIASNHTTYKGVAPGAKLVALKVCDNKGNCPNDDIMAGMDWCINNATKYNISVISISIGDKGSYTRQTCPTWLDSSINTAKRNGILVTISSGNDAHKAGISYPGCSENATSVSAVDKSMAIPGYANTATILDVLAPGGSPSQAITSTEPGNSFGSRYGTSMAAPHVAATAVLVQQFYKLEHGTSLSADEVQDVLKTSANNVTDPGNGLKFPLVNAFYAIRQLDDAAPKIYIIDPSGNYTTKNLSYTIRMQSNERLGWARIEVTGSNHTMNGVNTRWNYTLNTGIFYRYRVFGNDSAGHIGMSKTQTITINDSAPEILSFFPLTNASLAEPGNQSFNISYHEPNSQDVTIKWYKNNTQVSNTNKYIFKGNYSSSGSFTIRVVVNDSHYASSHFWTLFVNNTNRKPSVADAYITPALPGDNSTLECNNGSVTDLDKDLVSLYYDWYNGSWQHINSKILGAGNTSQGSKWNCSITPSDGMSNGTRLTSRSVDTSNSPPTLTPSPAAGMVNIKEPDNLTFSIAISHSYPTTIRWRKNLTLQGNQTQYKFKSNYSAGGSYFIDVNVSDGSMASTVNWTLIVNNTKRAPEQILQLPNQTAYPNQNISINLSRYFIDRDLSIVNYSFQKSSDISIILNGQIAKIVPKSNITGVQTFSVNCSDGTLTTKGNDFQIEYTKDLDHDGINSTIFGGSDCADSDPSIYPGATCTKTCRTGASYDYKCVCDGGTNSCASVVSSANPGGGGGGGIAPKKAGKNTRQTGNLTTEEKIVPKPENSSTSEQSSMPEAITGNAVRAPHEQLAQAEKPAGIAKAHEMLDWTSFVGASFIILIVCSIYLNKKHRDWNAHLAQLNSYIARRVAGGDQDNSIQASLRKHGWPDKIVNKQLASIKNKGMAHY